MQKHGHVDAQNTINCDCNHPCNFGSATVTVMYLRSTGEVDLKDMKVEYKNFYIFAVNSIQGEIINMTPKTLKILLIISVVILAIVSVLYMKTYNELKSYKEGSTSILQLKSSSIQGEMGIK